MGRYDGILICSDFDGTLFWRGEIPERNLRAIAEFEREGGAVYPLHRTKMGYFAGVFASSDASYASCLHQRKHDLRADRAGAF